MDPRTVDRGLNDRGVTSVQFILASALALILFLALANLVVVQYGRGAIRSALEQGARAGAVAGSSDQCEATAGHVIGQLLGGRMSDGLAIRCSVSGGQMIAVGSTVFETWTPLAPDITAALQAAAVIEPGS